MYVVTAANLCQNIMIIKVGQVMYRAVEINIVVKITFCVFGQIINAAHSQATVDNIGPFKKQIGTVKGAKRSAAGNNGRFPTGTVSDKRNYFVIDIIIKLVLPHGFV